jgi:hypothetical protein
MRQCDLPAPATDERGVARPQDGNLDTVAACDIGAIEVQPCFTVDKSCVVESVYVCTRPRRQAAGTSRG